MRAVTGASSCLAECWRKQHRIRPLREVVPLGKVAGEFVVSPVAKYKLDLITRAERFQVLHLERIGLPRVGTFHVDNLDYSGWHSVERALAAGLKQDLVAALQKLPHQGHDLTLLQHRLSAGDLDQAPIWAQPLDFGERFFRRHLSPAIERVFAVAPGTAQVAAREPDEHAWQARVRGLTLQRLVNLCCLHYRLPGVGLA